MIRHRVERVSERGSEVMVLWALGVSCKVSVTRSPEEPRRVDEVYRRVNSVKEATQFVETAMLAQFLWRLNFLSVLKNSGSGFSVGRRLAAVAKAASPSSVVVRSCFCAAGRCACIGLF